MNVYSIPQGVKVNNSQYTHPVLAIMLAASHYRRFILLLVICCISFFVFGWYTRNEETEALNESLFTEEFENPDYALRALDPQNAHLREQTQEYENEFPESSIYKFQNAFMEFLKEENVPNVLHLDEDGFKPTIDYSNLFPGPIEESVTFPNPRLEVQESQISSIPEPEYVTFPKSNLLYPDYKMENTVPGDSDFMKITLPSSIPPDPDMGNPDPTDPNYIKITPPSSSFMDIETEHPDSENSSFMKITPTSSSFQEKEYSDPISFSKMKVVFEVNNTRSKHDYINNKKYSQLTSKSTTPAYSVTRPVKNPGLIIDTPGCKIPKLDPWDPSVIDLYQKLPPLTCPGPPLFMKAQTDGSVSISETILLNHYNLTLEDISCFYQVLHRKHEEPGNVREQDYHVGKFRDMKFGVPLNAEFIGVICYMGPENATHLKEFHQYFPFVRLKPEVEEERSSIPPPEHKLNVILAGIDSISKLNFLRHFPRTHAFLKEKMTPFEMHGYTKVGDNTFPNLVPLLTGQFVHHYWNETLMDTMFFDHLDFIWKDYAKRGYRTLYAEDSPHTGTFQYLKRGFYDPPTDYYLRPLLLALEILKENVKYEEHCLNSQLETDLIYDYLRDFIQVMGSRPYIAFAMVSTITHNNLNKAGWADDPTVRLLESLHSSGTLNNSMLVLFSDHGLRFGPIRERYIGKIEERMPFMFVNFPKWFLEQNPQIENNLKNNQDRLITLFDVHATMIDLLDLKAERTPEEWRSITLGSSLMREISPNRTCMEGNIRAHWCPCQTFEEVALDDSIAVNCAQAIVKDINGKLQSYNASCAVLEIDKISDARVGQASDSLLSYMRPDDVFQNVTAVDIHKAKILGDYLITLMTKPGGAVFEGTVRHNSVNSTYNVLGISRINMYGNQSWCIDSQKMKIFCYCST